MSAPGVTRRARGARLGAALLLAVSASVSFSATNIALARFTDSRSVGGNTFTTGTWGSSRYYLHNNPTPPTGNTTAQFYLAMNSTVPTAGTLYNYDTDCSSGSPGRDFRRTGLGVYEVGRCKVANWVAPVLTSPLTVNGAATVSVWSATADFVTGVSANLTAMLVDYDPAAGTASLITSVSLTQPDWQGGSTTWVQKTLTFPSINYTLATGHRLEVRLVSQTSGSSNVWVAYDTATYRSYLQLP